MALYVYVTATGKLYSWSPNDTDPVAPTAALHAAGLTAVSGLPALDAIHVWQEAPPTVVTVLPTKKSIMVETSDWIMRFTPQEFAAIMASNDPLVQQFIYALNHTTSFDLANPVVVNAMNYMAAHPTGAPLVNTARIAALLASP